MPATIKPSRYRTSSVFHGTIASQSKKRHQSSTTTRPRSRSACRVPDGGRFSGAAALPAAGPAASGFIVEAMAIDPPAD
jgi:hypothetical protein